MPNILTDADKAKLLPCPFCGSKAAIWMDHRPVCTNAECNAEVEAGDYATLEQNIAAWNLRALPAQVEQEAVAWQWRRYYPKEGRWSEWRPCTKHYADETAALEGFEVRALGVIASPTPAAPAAPEHSDINGVPKTSLSQMEALALQVCNMVKAWADSDRSTPFPEEAHALVDAVLMFAAARRKGVQ